MVSSDIWKYFRKLNSSKTVCIACGKTFNITSNSTSSMWYHLKTASKNCYVRSTEKEEHIKDQQKRKKLDLRDFINQPIGYYLAKIASEDNMTLNRMINSEVCKVYLAGFRHNMPNSASTITTQIISFYNQEKINLKNRLQKLISQNTKFNITLDEWKSINDSKFLNIVLYSQQQIFNLGLCRLEGGTTSESILNIVLSKLSEFGLNLSQHIAVQTFDGANYMVKYGRLSGIPYTLCINHALHLAILKTIKENQEGVNSIKLEREDLIARVRSIVHSFKKSTRLSDILKDKIQSIYGPKSASTLIIDCKTRWSSLCDMLERFLRFFEEIKFVHLEVGKEFTITNEEKEYMQTLIESLIPVKILVRRFSSRTCFLYEAHKTISFLLDYLRTQNNDISSALFETIKYYYQKRVNKNIMNLIFEIHGRKIEEEYVVDASEKKLFYTDLIERLLPRSLYPIDKEEEIKVKLVNFEEKLDEMLDVDSRLSNDEEADRGFITKYLSGLNQNDQNEFIKVIRNIPATST